MRLHSIFFYGSLDKLFTSNIHINASVFVRKFESIGYEVGEDLLEPLVIAIKVLKILQLVWTNDELSFYLFLLRQELEGIHAIAQAFCEICELVKELERLLFLFGMVKQVIYQIY